MSIAKQLLNEGASDISFEIPGKADRNAINKKFSQQQKDDADYNGSRDGYSGDFQTVNKVDFNYLGKSFDDMDKAYDFALDKAKKWQTVVALYVTEKGKTTTLVAGWGAE